MMMLDFITKKLLPVVLILISACLFLLLVGCQGEVKDSNTTSGNAIEKASTQLIQQVELRKQQIANPTTERLQLMKDLGMNVENLDMQRVVIYMKNKPDTHQSEELQNMGMTLYLDSWIPPVGAHPDGYFLADMPVDKLHDLADKTYVVRLDTGERQLEPQQRQLQGGIG
jgi:hypothetical protein